MVPKPTRDRTSICLPESISQALLDKVVPLSEIIIFLGRTVILIQPDLVRSAADFKALSIVFLRRSFSDFS